MAKYYFSRVLKQNSNPDRGENSSFYPKPPPIMDRI
ncbi:hypothetical protein Zm00014a_001985 [Zea mays]|uniref:Uncharacterized protein n=1 Tax=Zea mays TaxID=4577 RepID=A0A317YLW3_MAIZE|nr:hypothetical protein Zm00014a_001985 [Zea mays]